MPTPLRQALALLTLASLTLLPPLTMAQTTGPLPPAEPMAQEVGALWDPATITPLKLLNIDLFSRSELGQPVVVQPVIPYPSVGGGSFAYCLETLDGLQSRLVEGIVCTDGFTLVRSLEMTFDEALALQAQFDISSGPAPVRRPTEFSWATFWTDTVVDPIHDLTETELSRRADWYDAVYPAAQDHELKLWLPAPADEEATDPTVVADPTNQRPVLTDIVGVAGVAMTTGAATDDAQANARFTLDGLDPATEFSTDFYCYAVASDEDNSDNPTDGTTDTIDPHDLSKENIQKAYLAIYGNDRLWMAFLNANGEFTTEYSWFWSSWRYWWDGDGGSHNNPLVTINTHGCQNVFQAACRLHVALWDGLGWIQDMKHDYFGSAKNDSEGYEELLTASRDRALQSAEILEAWVLTAGSLVDVVDIGLTLQDLGNSELSAGQKTLAVGGAALPIISGRVLTIGNKRCIPRDAPKTAAARGLARATEHIDDAASSIIARNRAAELAGLGDDAIPFVSKVGPQKGWTIGRQSPNGKRGWRMDWDPDKGYHVNWWDQTGGAKRKDWIYGAIKITDGTWDDYIDLLKHGFGN